MEHKISKYYWYKHTLEHVLNLSFMYVFAPVYFRYYFTSIHSIHSIGTRQSRKGGLYAIHCNTIQYGLRSIHYSGVRIWN